MFCIKKVNWFFKTWLYLLIKFVQTWIYISKVKIWLSTKIKKHTKKLYYPRLYELKLCQEIWLNAESYCIQRHQTRKVEKRILKITCFKTGTPHLKGFWMFGFDQTFEGTLTHNQRIYHLVQSRYWKDNNLFQFDDPNICMDFCFGL